jgi:H+/Cl- antiporter ClcA/CBS domain-containing protein
MTTTIPESKVLPPPNLSPNSSSISEHFTSLLNRLQPSPESLMLISALLIGGSCGLIMVLFHYLIDLCETLTFSYLMSKISIWGAWTVALVPILGGFLVGMMRWRYLDIFRQEFSALLLNPGEESITLAQPLVKMMAAVISLGTGASLGKESPSVEIGSNIGILLGQLFQVSKERYRVLLGAGAAAGLAAGFNAPIAGVFFALEVVLDRGFTTPAASLIVLSAVVSSIISRIFLGVHPAFDLPDYQLLSHWEWFFYLGLGLLASLISLIYIQGIKLAQVWFEGKVVGWDWVGQLNPIIKTILGGACVGIVALKLPQVMGIGYGTVELILTGQQFSLYLLSLLLVFKLALTAISLGSGLVGGVFAPAMFLGACLGAIYGNIINHLLSPEWLVIAPPPAYAMIGMAAVLAGSVRAPLTAILLLFELTGNYQIILPLMAAVGVSIWVVELITSQQNAGGLNLQQMGMNLAIVDEKEILQKIRVGAVMERSYLALSNSLSIGEAGLKMVKNRCHTAVVINAQQQLSGILTLNDIKRAIVRDFSQMNESVTKTSKPTVGDIYTAEILFAYPDEAIATVIERMEARGIFLLPVVSRKNPRQILGTINKNQISLATDLVVTQAALRPYLSES